jgi:hypothetical protein
MSKLALVFLGSALLVGCGSGSAPTTVDDETGATADTANDETLVSDTSDDTAPVAPNAPKIISLMKMGGNLHVAWALNDTGITLVELWRKKDAGDYVLAYSWKAPATNQHDTDAVAPGTFCYKVRSGRGDLLSEFSNEKCGTL